MDRVYIIRNKLDGCPLPSAVAARNSLPSLTLPTVSEAEPMFTMFYVNCISAAIIFIHSDESHDVLVANVGLDIAEEE